jgi:hypothetical protein
MPVSSNTLFHFTSDLDSVFSILADEFHPHFCLENFNVLAPRRSNVPELEFAVPLVSFCDIPLSQVEKHMDAYGRYGIGMRKEWGTKRKVAPVLYTYRGSRLATSLHSLIVGVNRLSAAKKDVRQIQDHFYNVTSFIKPYRGLLVRHGKRMARHKFYDEREWRFVPRMPRDFFRYGMLKVDYLNPQRRYQANAALWRRSRIRFAPSDIKYIIVARESEIIHAIHHVEYAKSRFGPDQVRLVISRIVSAEQILEDF